MSEYIEIKGIENFFKACDKLIDMNKHGQSIMAGAGESIRNSIIDSFKNERSIFNGKWKSLKPATIKQKIKDGKNKGILKRDGDLSNDLNWQSEPTKSGVKVFNNMQSKSGFKYGLVHQYGSRKKNIPARSFLPIDNNNVLHQSIRSVIYKDTKDFIVKIAKK
ncbi:phage virion morphogenesis protein [Campylobacter coli]|uniref:phage virion morphogenesis protein n=1 Tax=Campylobacter coli TaxID=195 RepID=UPI00025824F1|nr:phage virion morphogenesis protein [Campylobacter coli]EAK3302758.1 virion morphogenesis protein [Campylobacter hyointestinalis]EAL5101008.1 virion morphogenesis protein [Campylobacter jejuni]EAC1314887.1 virion morphogenesis protein [Campylobacter coli]EAC1340688.1 virion morphogenesis protein [Campylobacter coli]EAC1764822.1 virion morphogenesis protein [Campylobacter coli]